MTSRSVRVETAIMRAPVEAARASAAARGAGSGGSR